MARVIGRLLLACAAAGLGACDGGQTATPAAPPPAPPPPPPAFSASFPAEGLEVREGSAIEVPVQYEVRELASPVELRIAGSGDSASADDYELSTDAVSIPAGEDLAGEASVVLTALSDLSFIEGSEELSLEFVAPAGVEATLGDPTNVTILEAGASPCPGVTLIGLPWRAEESSDEDIQNMLATTLTLELAAGATGTRLDLLGPYFDLGTYGRIAESVSAFGINRWSLRTDGGSMIHELDINWSGESWYDEEAEASLDIGFGGGACSGEPVASCTSGGCEIIP